jgi:hypothetical protein
MSPTMTTTRTYGMSSFRNENKYAQKDLTGKAVIVEDGSVIVNPKYMKQGEFLLAVVNEKPYLYRKISNCEIEVHGLA